MVSSMLSVFLPQSSQSPASSQSPIRRCIPSAQRNSCPSSMRMTTLLSFSGTLSRQTPCRQTTLPSSKKCWLQTTCAWEGLVVVGQIYFQIPWVLEWPLWVSQVLFYSLIISVVFIRLSLSAFECADNETFYHGILALYNMVALVGLSFLPLVPNNNMRLTIN